MAKHLVTVGSNAGRDFDAVRARGEARRAAAKKSADAEVPARLPDPHGVGFTDAELDALTDTDNEESVKLAYGTATPAVKGMLGAGGGQS